MAGILDEIIAHKRRAELPTLPRVDRRLLADLPPCRGFAAALDGGGQGPVRVIAECKKASPSKGVIRPDYDPVLTALYYVHGGASCISVLTDRRYFQGSLEDLVAVRAAVSLPIIRKDFIIDERQIFEARRAGADAVLLIAACLGRAQLEDLHGFACDIGLDVLVEVHDADEAARAVALKARLIGVNNRNLQTFAVDLGTTIELAPGITASGALLVAESGIETRADCIRVEAVGAAAVLVGESLMRAADPADALRRLRGLPLAGPLG